MLKDDVITKDQERILKKSRYGFKILNSIDGIERDKAKFSSFLIGREMLLEEFHKDDSRKRFRHFCLIYIEKDGQINDLAFAVIKDNPNERNYEIKIVPGTCLGAQSSRLSECLSVLDARLCDVV